MDNTTNILVHHNPKSPKLCSTSQIANSVPLYASDTRFNNIPHKAQVTPAHCSHIRYLQPNPHAWGKVYVITFSLSQVG